MSLCSIYQLSEKSVSCIHSTCIFPISAVVKKMKERSPPVQVIVVLVTAFNDWSKEKQFRGLQVGFNFTFVLLANLPMVFQMIFTFSCEWSTCM